MSKNFIWFNRIDGCSFENGRILIRTAPYTDLWQKTYYGFQNNNAPGFVEEITGDFSMSVKARFVNASQMYDQCGVLVYHGPGSWIKVSVEKENGEFSRLGSVVTNYGFSDWASCDIPAGIKEMWYRVNRRGQDFLLESSRNGMTYEQMRICHLHDVPEMIWAGVYACSPLDSAFTAEFTDLGTGPCTWPSY